MANHVYECKNGHRIEQREPADFEHKHLVCGDCFEQLKLSAAVSTGAPVLKEGSGGFYKPTPKSVNE